MKEQIGPSKCQFSYQVCRLCKYHKTSMVHSGRNLKNINITEFGAMIMLFNQHKKYFHLLSDEEWKKMLDKKTWSWINKHYKQPPWCDYPEALGGLLGCWSLIGAFGEHVFRNERIRKEKDCEHCDCYKTNTFLRRFFGAEYLRRMRVY